MALCCLNFFVARPTPVHAATGINHQINFQGKLVNTNGTNVTDGTYTIVFSIYSVSSGGSAIWTETQTPAVTTGIFQVALGSVTTLPGSIDFNTDNIYLGIKVGSDAEMTPRIQFTAVPQAFNAEKLGGLDKTGFVQLGQGSMQNVSTATSAVQINQQGAGAIFQLQGSGTDVFTLSNTGNILLGNNADHTLSVTTSAASTAGRKVTISAGAAGTGASALAGGDVVIQAGAGGGTNGNGGNLTFNPGVKNGTGAAGTVLFKPGAAGNDSVTFLQIQPAGSATPVFNVDTTNSRIGLGTSSPDASLHVVGGGVCIENTETTCTGLTAGNVAVNGGTIQTTSTTGSIFNATVTNLSVGGAATTLSLGGSGGVATLGNGGAFTVQSSSNQNLTITGNGTGDIVFSTDADSNVQVNATAAPGVDQVAISNSGQPVLTAGVNSLSVNYVGGTPVGAGIEAGAARIDLQPGGSPGSGASVWNGLRFVGNVTGPAANVTENGVKLEGPATTGGAGTFNGINIANIGTVASGGIVRGININATNSQAAGNVYGIQLQNLTAGAATERGIDLGTGWDNLITYNAGATTIVNGSGQLNLSSVFNTLGVGNGGTGVATTPTNGQLLIGNGTNYTVASLGTTGLTATPGAGSLSLSVNYGSGANNAAAGANTFTCPSGSGNLTGGGTVVTIGTSGTTCGAISTNNAVTFSTSVSTPLLQNAGAITLGTTATGGADDIIFQTAGTEKWRILENGNLQRTAAGTTTADLIDSSNTTLALTNSGTGVANLTVDGAITAATGLTVSANGATITGNSTIAGTLGSLTGLTSSGTITFSGLNTAGIVTNTSGGVLGTTNAVAANLGGTGFNSYTVGDLLYANTSSTLAKLIDVATGSCLTSGGAGVAPAWGTCTTLTATNGLNIASNQVGLGGTLNNSTTTLTSGGVNSQLQISAGSNVPTADQLNITNTGSSGVAASGVNNLSLNFKGAGASAIESGASRIDIQAGSFTGSVFNGERIVANATGPATGVTLNGTKIEGPATTGGAGTFNGINIANIGTVASGGIVRGINITGTNSQAAGNVYGIQLQNLTAGAATERGIDLGTGWDNLITYNAGATTIVNGSGQLNLSSVFNTLGVGNGGTGVATTPTNGQLLIGNGTNYTVASLGTTGLTATPGAGSLSLAVNYGSGANNAAAGANTFTCPSGSGNLTGGGTVVTIGTSGTTCGAISTNNAVTFSTSVSTPLLQNAGAITLGTTATGGADDIIFQTAGTEKWRILENGNLQRTAAGTTTADLIDSSNTTLALTNSGTGVANLTVDGAITAATGLTVSANGATITGNSTIAGTLGSLTGLTSSGTITFSGLNTAGIVTNTSGGVLGTTNAVAANLGGTGFNSYTVGDLLYANTSSTLAKLIDVATGSCLTSGGAGVAPAWGTCTTLTATNGLNIASNQVGLGGTLNNSTTTLTSGGVNSQLQITSGSNVPAVDQLTITNTSSTGVVSTNTNALSINYKGGAAAVESAASRIAIQPGSTNGGVWNGQTIVANATGPATGVLLNDLKIEGPATTGGAGTFNGINIANIGTVASGGIVRGININATNSQAAGNVYGIQLQNLTAGAATERGIDLGTGWDNLITYNAGATTIVNGSGQLNLSSVFNTLGAANGGTGIGGGASVGVVLGGNGSGGWVLTNINGTSNRLGVSSVSGGITLDVDATQFPNSASANTILQGTGANAASWTGTPTLTRLTLTQATGTAPLTVSSTTLVTNLNADLLDGLSSAAFAPATVNSFGYIVQAPGSTAQNTITPTVASVVGLTVNGTSSTAATAVSIIQGGNATALNVAGSGTGNLAVLDTSNASANGVSIDVQSSSSSQYALSVTSNNAVTNGLIVRADGNVGIGTALASINSVFTLNGGPQPASQAGAGTAATAVLTVTGGQGGNTSATVNGTPAGTGAAISVIAGTGGNATNSGAGGGAGGAGGSLNIDGGPGGTTGGTTGLGGTGGAISIAAGPGGASTNSSATTAHGGNGGQIFIVGGDGGLQSGTTGTSGVGGNVILQGGTGGAEINTTQHSIAGNVQIYGGTGSLGSGTTANGNGGDVLLQGGNPGSGGSGTAGTSGSVVISGDSSKTSAYLEVKDSTSKVSLELLPISSANQRLQFNLYGTLEVTPTNYSRLSQYYDTSSNVFKIETQNGGTGTFRNLVLQSGGGNVGIGTTSNPGNKLSINSLTTADSLAQIAVATGSSTNKGLIIQGSASQTADLLQAQDSTGVVLDSINASGTLTQTSHGPSYVGGADAAATINSGTGTNATNVTGIAVLGNFMYAVTSGNGANNCTQTAPSGCEIQVFDASNPAIPTYLGGVDADGTTNGGGAFNNNYYGVTISGHYLYALAGANGTACGQSAGSAIGCEIQVYDLTNPASPTYVAGMDSTGSSNGTGASNGATAQYTSITVSGHYLYATKQGDSTACAQTAGNAIGCELQIYDISNPLVPAYIAGMDGNATNSGTSLHDESYATVSGHYLYAVGTQSITACTTSAGIGCELQVYDISNPASPTFVGGNDVSGTTAVTGTGVSSRASNAVAVSGRYLYTVGNGNNSIACSSTVGSAIGCELQIYDISTPNTPAYVGGTDSSGNTNSGSTAVARLMLAISGGYLYLGGNGNVTACSQTPNAIGCELQVYNISTPTAPTYLGGADVSGTTNGGTIGRAVNAITISGRYVYTAGVTDNTGACSQTAGSANGCEIQVYDASGVEATSVNAGSLQTGTLQVTSGATIASDLSVSGSATIGQALAVAGGLTATTLQPTAVTTGNGIAATAVMNITGGTGGNTSSVAGGTGGAGSLVNIVSGTGGNATNTNGGSGGAGGAFTIATGNGGTTGQTGVIGLKAGTGGTLTISTGAGGASTGGTSYGGDGGAISILSGAGGTANGTTLIPGTGGAITIQAGAGGAEINASTAASTGGTVTIKGGSGGAGTGTSVNSNGGNLLLQGGAHGTGGSGTAGTEGAVIVKPQTDNTAAFQVQTSGGAQILTVDTTNTGLYINGDVLQTGNGVNALGDQESMVPNSGFEVNNDGTATVADNWTFAQTVATATPSVTTTSPGQGDRSQQMAMSGTTAEGDFTSACVPISATQAYTLSLRFKGTAASTTALDTFLDTYTSKANCVSKTSVTTVNGSVGVAATNAWAAVSTALGNTGLTATWGRVRVRLGSAGTATNLFIDGVRLTPSAVTSGIDVAENYPAQASDNLVPGELVSFGDTAPNGEAYAVRSASKYDSKLFGVVSTQPGLVLDDGKGYEHVTVALAGRVPVRVSDENGAINIGDPITASSIPGVGMKATEPGQIIGYAMQSFSGDGQTGIIVKVQPGFWAPTSGQVLQSTAAQFGSLQISGIANIASLNVTGPATLASLTVTGDVTVHGKLTASIITVTDRLFVNGHLLSEGVKPNIAKDSNLGNDGQVLGANITIDGTDTAGTITLTAGTSAHSGVLATVSFNKPYEQAPRVVLSPTSADSLGLPVFIQKTDNGFQIVTTGTPQAGKNYQFDYVVIGSSSVAQN